jgi:hypothetical protein
MKNLLRCIKCKKEFITTDEAVEHSKKKKHHEFEVKEIQKMRLMIG